MTDPTPRNGNDAPRTLGGVWDRATGSIGLDDRHDVRGLTMQGQCYKHGFEASQDSCRHCGLAFCAECLVYSFGPNKPPYCISCALGASGVRANAALQTNVSRREIRRLEKERKKALKAQRSAAPGKIEVQLDVTADDPVPVLVPDVEENPFAWADDPQSGQRVPF